MIETVFLFGVIIFAGLAALFAAMPIWLRHWLMVHELLTAMLVTVLTAWMHWGTMTGMMSAAFAGLITSGACKAGRWWWRIA